MLFVGLTGGIASGKSTVAAIFADLGARLIDADLLARRAVEPGTGALGRVAAEFGGEYLLPDGSLDRKKMGRLVFSDSKRRAALEAIVHPEVWRLAAAERERIVREDSKAVIIYDAALLIESGGHRKADRVIVVAADAETQILRLMGRDRLSRQEARRRVEAQMPLEEKKKFADHLIDSTWPIDRIKEECKRLYALFLDLAAGRPIK